MRSGLPRSMVEGVCSIEATCTVDFSLTAAAPSTTLLTQGGPPVPFIAVVCRPVWIVDWRNGPRCREHRRSPVP
jgi:hypothetical protein